MKTTICAAALALLLGTACYGQKRMSQPAAASGASCESVYDVRDFGAKGDGKADDTKAVLRRSLLETGCMAGMQRSISS